MANPVEREQAVLTLLKNLRGLDSLKKLFWSELNYDSRYLAAAGIKPPLLP